MEFRGNIIDGVHGRSDPSFEILVELSAQAMNSGAQGAFLEVRLGSPLLLGICFWREARGTPGWAEYMGEK
ncbi:MAG: hypothetical protein CBC46_01765 [Verrucomicrobiaceae bacterium TMED86]|nr:MAG: hypothetical protein CBC46_01765 [Verrucomicrobiaceae bacterium TMED86]